MHFFVSLMKMKDDTGCLSPKKDGKDLRNKLVDLSFENEF